ncbi:HNH endonuclease signature motif containing protein [Paeniglutamicibacter antarcticus]|uniref:HNH nuclease domain-containing protein n=1 Tax=Paeniglutamicibacter antarcticus TaxID=494023 RepID=A0ABP9TM39_9MICC
MNFQETIEALTHFRGLEREKLDTTTAMRLLLAAAGLQRNLVSHLAQTNTSPVLAAMLVQVVESAHRTAGHQQLLVASNAQHALVQELPSDSLDEVHRITREPAGFIAGSQTPPADPQTVPTGRMPHLDTAGYLQASLHLSIFEARNRMEAADLLLPRSTRSGEQRPAVFQLLAETLASANAEPREVIAAAHRLRELRPRIAHAPNPIGTARDIERQVAQSLITAESKVTTKLIKTLAADFPVVDIASDPAELLSHTGMFYRGEKSGLHYYSLVLSPLDAEYVVSLNAATDNPRTLAGDRERLFDESPISPSSGTSTADRDKAQDLLPGLGSQPSGIPAWALAPKAEDGSQCGESVAIQDSFRPDPARAVPNPNEHAMAPGVIDGLTVPQRHLQSMMNLLRTNTVIRGPGEGTTGLPSPTLVVHFSAQSLLEMAEANGITTHGHPVTVPMARTLLCNGEFLPVVFNGKGKVLDLGRISRRFPAHMKRAVLARDGGCLVPGCTVPPEHVEFHHREAWSLGGGTSVKNCLPACTYHHHMIHLGYIQAVDLDGLPHVIMPGHLDPERKPRRNTYWGIRPLISVA